jgi:N-acetylneuraminic acid mutarotase
MVQNFKLNLRDA